MIGGEEEKGEWERKKKEVGGWGGQAAAAEIGVGEKEKGKEQG
jgi:hypothetical protein